MKLKRLSFVPTESTLSKTLISVYYKSWYSVQTKHHFSRPATVSHAVVALKMRLSCDIQATFKRITFELWKYHILNKAKTHDHAFCLDRMHGLGVLDLVQHRTERASQEETYTNAIVCLAVFVVVSLCVFMSVCLPVSHMYMDPSNKIQGPLADFKLERDKERERERERKRMKPRSVS